MATGGGWSEFHLKAFISCIDIEEMQEAKVDRRVPAGGEGAGGVPGGEGGTAHKKN